MRNPAVILYDANGVAMAVADGVAIPVGTQAVLVAGNDSGTARFVRTTSDGTVRIDPIGATTQPISAASLPLPTGGATEATLATRLAEATFTARVNTLGQKAMAASTPVALASDQSSIPVTDGGASLTVDGAVTANIGTTNGLALDATLTDGTQRANVTDGTNDAAVKAASTAAVAADPALVVAVSPNNTIPVSAASLPLPTGAATSANQTTLGAQTTEINNGTNTADVTGANALKVDGSAVTQPVSAASLPLPTGAATEATLATRATEATLATRVADATVTARLGTLGQKAMVGSTPVAIASDQTSIPVTDDGGSLTVDTPQLPGALVGGRLDENVGAWLGSTAPTVGQKTEAGSIPTVLASDQTAIPVTDDGGSLTVDGTVTAEQGTAAALSGAWPVQHTDGTNVTPTMDVVGRAGYQQITDGTNGPAAIKPSTTPPLVTDPSMVVVLSPNQQAIPVTSTPANVDSGLRGGFLQLGGGSSGNLYAVRGTSYTEQTTNAQRSVASSDANDTVAGTGARQLLITYLDQTGAGPFTETVTLNGTTPVNTVASDICYIESLVVTATGATTSNVGTLTLYAATAGGGAVVATVGVGNAATGVGDNRTLWCHHYVASGATAQITGFDRGASSSSRFYLKAKAVGADQPEVIISGVSVVSGDVPRTFGSPIEIAGPALVTAYGIPSTNGVTLTSSIDFFDE